MPDQPRQLAARPPSVRPGSGTPFTERGRSVAFGPPPWQMRGRTLALWYRLADPDEARRHVPGFVTMDPDPVVRARFWDMEHDAVPAHDGSGQRWTPFREAVVAFPVTLDGASGDFPTYMYANEFAYTVFGREVMGWPVRDGRIEIDPSTDIVPGPGTRLAGRLIRDGRLVMEATVELTGEREVLDESEPPRWLVLKSIPRVDRPGEIVSQLVVTGPERIHHRTAWAASGSLAFWEGSNDELHFLAAREIVAAQLWSDVELTIGWGRVLLDLSGGGDVG